MSDLIFYTNPMSRGRIVRWMLEELGEPYKTVLLDYATGMKATDYLAINPMGKVPALRHGETIITEAAAICAYIADAFPRANLAPPHGDSRRGPYYRWMFFAAGPVEAAVTHKALKVTFAEDRSRILSYGSFEATMAALETAVSQTPFITGDQFTAADVYVGSQIGWGMMFGTIDKRPAFVDYVGRLRSRPAALRASALDDAIIAEQKAGETAR